MMRAWRAALLLPAAACTVGQLDLSGRACPCVFGYTCDAVTRTCRPDTGDGGLVGTDGGGPGDAGGIADHHDASQTDGSVDTCPNTTTDPLNCGACGHDCLGGVCQNSICEPVVLASGQNVPSAIAVDSTSVYWVNLGTGTNDGAIVKCAIGGCGNSPTVLASGQASPLTLVVSSAGVFWIDSGAGQANEGAVFGCANNGCNNNPTTLASGQNYPTAIAADATNVYWVNSGTYDTTGSQNGSVVRCAASGCNGNPTAIASGLQQPEYLAITGTSALFMGPFAGVEVYECALSGCGNSPTPFASSGFGSAFGLVADGTNAYFWGGTIVARQLAHLSVVECSVGGCDAGPTVLDMPQVLPSGVASDGKTLYMTMGAPPNVMPTAGTLVACAINGCSDTPALLASSQDGPSSVAVDATGIYWADQFGGTIMRLAK
jgi:hypothetical protein